MISNLLVLLQVLFIDIVLAGDNAVAVGMAAAGLPTAKRRKAIVFGIGVATVLRIGGAIFASMLLNIIGLLLAGGLLLAWICWRMWREVRDFVPEDSLAVAGGDGLAPAPRSGKSKSVAQAVRLIVAADLSMSIDNVLAVAGAAREHPLLLAFGLIFSVILMGVAASLIATLLNRHRWIAYVGLAVILGVALSMIYRGGLEVVRAAAGRSAAISVTASLTRTAPATVRPARAESAVRLTFSNRA